MRRIGRWLLAVLVAFVVWLSTEFIRARVTDGLPAGVQVGSMAVPILVGIVAGRRAMS